MSTMYHLLQVSPSHHTGRLLHHHHTSYGHLFGLVLIATIITFILVPRANAAIISAEIAGPPPATAAEIETPHTGDSISSDTLVIAGSCLPNTFIALFGNSQLLGSTACNNAHFSFIPPTLPNGSMVLVARDYYIANSPGPDSTPVTITIAPIVIPNPSLPPSSVPITPPATGTHGSHLATPVSTTPASSIQSLQLKPSQYFWSLVQGVSQIFSMSVNGGHAPYVWSWDWGDNSPIERVTTGMATSGFSHTYNQAGSYALTATVTDSLQQTSKLVLAAKVAAAGISSQPSSRPVSPVPSTPPWVKIAYGLVTLLIATFWLVERPRLKHRGLPA